MEARPVQGMALLPKTANVIVLATPSNYAVVVAVVVVAVVVVVVVEVEVELEEVEKIARIVM